MSVREKIAQLEKKTREAEIVQEERALKVSKLFWDQSQSKLYPLANTLQTPTTYESMYFEDMNETKEDAEVEKIFVFNMRNLSNNNMTFVEDVRQELLREYDYSSLNFLNTSWQDFTQGLTRQFKKAKINTETFLKFVRKYLKDYEPPYNAADDSSVSALSGSNSGTLTTPYGSNSGSNTGTVSSITDSNSLNDTMSSISNSTGTFGDSMSASPTEGTTETLSSGAVQNILNGSPIGAQLPEVANLVNPDLISLWESDASRSTIPEFTGFQDPSFIFRPDFSKAKNPKVRMLIDAAANSLFVKGLINNTRQNRNARDPVAAYITGLGLPLLMNVQDYVFTNLPDYAKETWLMDGDQVAQVTANLINDELIQDWIDTIPADFPAFDGFRDENFNFRSDRTSRVKIAKVEQLINAAEQSDYVKALLNLTRDRDYREPVNSFIRSLSLENLLNVTEFIWRRLPDTSGNGLKKRKPAKKVFKGRGVLQSNINDKYYVDMTHLNMTPPKFSLKYRSTGKIIIRPTAVTQNQKQIIMDILTNKFDQKRYDKLSASEEPLITQFCTVAKIKCVPKLEKEIDDLSTKMQVLIGELEAGNDSPDIKKMLAQCTEKLMQRKGITKLEGLTILNQLK